MGVRARRATRSTSRTTASGPCRPSPSGRSTSSPRRVPASAGARAARFRKVASGARVVAHGALARPWTLSRSPPPPKAPRARCWSIASRQPCESRLARVVDGGDGRGGGGGGGMGAGQESGAQVAGGGRGQGRRGGLARRRRLPGWRPPSGREGRRVWYGVFVGRGFDSRSERGEREGGVKGRL